MVERETDFLYRPYLGYTGRSCPISAKKRPNTSSNWLLGAAMMLEASFHSIETVGRNSEAYGIMAAGWSKTGNYLWRPRNSQTFKTS